ncbi:hypothetical protein [Prauserella muralis]|uniref:Uncharacterized protein n=1 Tax=Prauserella muralis TaxID=588067 RepID=A0A2V4AKT0_9PSEU|nr:hypothetical protein [Prauserella muralis]PXY20908.1 hypothetical protein BAY60_25770 [Prauserella muralis]TWE29957.1 hypothetical protein FHX69_2651 [Prauserella muralis]
MDTTGTAPGTLPHQAAATRLAAMLLAGGSMHFLAPRFFDGIIPQALPGQARTYTYVSGLAALALGAGLAAPPTRRAAAGLASAFFVAVMPAKVQLALDWCRSDTTPLPAKIAGIGQLFWQVPLVTEALKVRRGTPRRSRGSR